MSAQKYPLYTCQAVQAWEQRWFAQGNSSLGAMQQAAYLSSQLILQDIQQYKIKHVLLWCGAGNNGGDGYFIAQYLAQQGVQVEIYAIKPPATTDAKQAAQFASTLTIHSTLPEKQYQLHIDALFGIGLNRSLSESAQQQIEQFNQATGFKIAIDIPSGLHPNTGMPLPIACKVDKTYCLLGYKLGLWIGQAAYYVGQVQLVPLIPPDSSLQAIAWLDLNPPKLPARLPFAHKGNFGHVLVIGGHPAMGGAVLMAAEAAMASGAGKLTVVCAHQHHTAIVARSPNLMLADIDNPSLLQQLIGQVDSVALGMGLGRDDWARQKFSQLLPLLLQANLTYLVLDADALWFLAELDIQLPPHCILTPHSGEAARLLDCTAQQVEQDRIAAIYALQKRYGGQWVLKGAGSLTLESAQLQVCPFGNAGMATGGMGDVLSGMIVALKAQFQQQISLAHCVALHALAGDKLAAHGQRGLQAQYMPTAIHQVINA